MPVNPSPDLLKQFGIQQPQVPVNSGMQGPMPIAKPLLPSWMQTGFEGGIEGILGMLGFGDRDNKMNQVGQLGAAAIPMLGSGIGLASRIKPAMQAAPEADEIGQLISQMSNNLKKIPGGQNPIYDEAGRFLAMERPDDPAYLAHVASSRNKNPMPPANTPLKSKYSELAPNNDMLEQLMAKYKK
jgi:hypothetical protein